MITSKTINQEKEFLKYIICKDYYKFLKEQLSKYPQHGSTSIFKHSRDVAYNSYKIGLFFNNKFKTSIDLAVLVEAGYMHDFFMYDWHEPSTWHRLHGFTHPKVAAENAVKYCNASDKVIRIINTHMWPLTITKVPTSREAWIHTMSDKATTIYEFFHK